MELIIAISLMGIIILGVTSFDFGSRQMFKSSERKTQVMNEAALIMDHIAKDTIIAIGDVDHPAINVASPAIDPSTIVIQQDSNLNGVLDSASDVTVTYTRSGNQITRTEGTSAAEVLSNRATNFTASAPSGNSVEILLQLMYNTTASENHIDNPKVTIQSSVEAPAWSVN